MPDLKKGRILRYTADRRQVGLVVVYQALLFAMYFVPSCRNAVLLIAACGLSFLNTIVIHNDLHVPMFRSTALNNVFKCILSFGALYPASANIPAHNVTHHQFDDDGADDWAASDIVRFRWHLLNLLHFPNVAGPQSFTGIRRWMKVRKPPGFARQYYAEIAFSLGLTSVLLAADFWNGLFFIVVPQLWGARSILRTNLILHDGCDTQSRWNHSRNFVGRAFNWVMCNNGYHTVHHDSPATHWAMLAETHRIARPRIHPSLDEKSMGLYLLRTFFLRVSRPRGLPRDPGNDAVPTSGSAPARVVGDSPVITSGSGLLSPTRFGGPVS